ncbi:hypothetical protein pb186bvf_015511 [Paramecium bursaria]
MQFTEKEKSLIKQRFEQISSNGQIDKEQFKESLGILGLEHATFLVDRLYNIITESVITLQQYQYFLLIAMKGSEKQNAQLSFKFMDFKKKGFITQQDFEQMLFDLIVFWNFITESKLVIRQDYISNLWELFNTIRLDFEQYEKKFEEIESIIDWYDFFNYVGVQESKKRNDNYEQVQNLIHYIQSTVTNCVNLLSNHEKEQKLVDVSQTGPCNFSHSMIQKEGDSDPSFDTSILLRLEQLAPEDDLQKGHLDQIYQNLINISNVVTNTINYQDENNSQEIAIHKRFSIIRKRATIKNWCERLPKQQISVYFGHENWNLILNIMIGLRKAILRIQPEFFIQSSLKDEFQSYQKFTVIESMTNLDDKKSYQFKDYAPQIFMKIRQLYCITNQMYMRSIGPEFMIGNLLFGKLNTLTELGSTGKSGSFFYFTQDSNYMIKTISKNEALFFKKILPNYYNHLRGYKNSLLGRIFGFHQIKTNKGDKIYLISIVNVFRSGIELDFRYDIKGSLYGRNTLLFDPQIALKDQDMLKNKDYLKLEDNDRKLFIDAIQYDSHFLRANQIIDYSLLIGYHKRSKSKLQQYGQYNCSKLFYESFEGGLLSSDREWIYYIGIIDILTNYGYCNYIIYIKIQNQKGPRVFAKIYIDKQRNIFKDFRILLYHNVYSLHIFNEKLQIFYLNILRLFYSCIQYFKKQSNKEINVIEQLLREKKSKQISKTNFYNKFIQMLKQVDEQTYIKNTKSMQKMQEIADRITTTTPDITKFISPDAILKPTKLQQESQIQSKKGDQYESKNKKKPAQTIQMTKNEMSSQDWINKCQELQLSLTKAEEKIKQLELELLSRQERYVNRELEYRKTIEELQQELRSKTALDQNDRKIMENIYKDHGKIIDGINNIQLRTSKILVDQERDIIRFFNNKITEIKKQFEEERIKKGKNENEFIEKENQLLSELEWIKNIAQKIDNESHELMNKYKTLKEQYQTQENDREMLIKELLTKKKKNAILKCKLEEYEKMFANLEKEDNQQDSLDQSQYERQSKVHIRIKSVKRNQQGQMQSSQVKTIRSQDDNQSKNNSGQEFQNTQLRFEKTIKALQSSLQKEQKRVRDLKQQYVKEMEKKNELEKILRKCIEDVKDEIIQIKAEARTVHRKSMMIKCQIKKKGIKLLKNYLNNEKILTLLHDNTFYPDKKKQLYMPEEQSNGDEYNYEDQF